MLLGRMDYDFRRYCTEKRTKSDIVTTALILLVVHVHAAKMMDLSLCHQGSDVDHRLAEADALDYKCTSSAASKFLVVLRNIHMLWKLIFRLKGPEQYLMACALVTLAWLATAVASQYNPTARRFYTSGARLVLVVSTKFAAKLCSICMLFIFPDAPLSTFWKWYMPIDGVVLIWQSITAPVGASVQAAIAAADAACTFYCCWLLCDRWPYVVSMGTVLAGNLLLALASMVLSERVEHSERRSYEAAVLAERSRRPPMAAGYKGGPATTACAGRPSASEAGPACRPSDAAAKDDEQGSVMGEGGQLGPGSCSDGSSPVSASIVNGGECAAGGTANAVPSTPLAATTAAAARPTSPAKIAATCLSPSPYMTTSGAGPAHSSASPPAGARHKHSCAACEGTHWELNHEDGGRAVLAVHHGSSSSNSSSIGGISNSHTGSRGGGNIRPLTFPVVEALAYSASQQGLFSPLARGQMPPRTEHVDGAEGVEAAGSGAGNINSSDGVVAPRALTAIGTLASVDSGGGGASGTGTTSGTCSPVVLSSASRSLSRALPSFTFTFATTSNCSGFGAGSTTNCLADSCGGVVVCSSTATASRPSSGSIPPGNARDSPGPAHAPLPRLSETRGAGGGCGGSTGGCSDGGDVDPSSWTPFSHSAAAKALADGQQRPANGSSADAGVAGAVALTAVPQSEASHLRIGGLPMQVGDAQLSPTGESRALAQALACMMGERSPADAGRVLDCDGLRQALERARDSGGGQTAAVAPADAESAHAPVLGRSSVSAAISSSRGALRQLQRLMQALIAGGHGGAAAAGTTTATAAAATAAQQHPSLGQALQGSSPTAHPSAASAGPSSESSSIPSSSPRLCSYQSNEEGASTVSGGTRAAAPENAGQASTDGGATRAGGTGTGGGETSGGMLLLSSDAVWLGGLSSMPCLGADRPEFATTMSHLVGDRMALGCQALSADYAPQCVKEMIVEAQQQQQQQARGQQDQQQQEEQQEGFLLQEQGQQHAVQEELAPHRVAVEAAEERLRTLPRQDSQQHQHKRTPAAFGTPLSSWPGGDAQGLDAATVAFPTSAVAAGSCQTVAADAACGTTAAAATAPVEAAPPADCSNTSQQLKSHMSYPAVSKGTAAASPPVLSDADCNPPRWLGRGLAPGQEMDDGIAAAAAAVMAGARSPPRYFSLARALAARGGQNAVYNSPALCHTRCSVKLSGITPAELPRGVAGRVGALLAVGCGPGGAGGGVGGVPPMAAVGVYVREGCVEVVADLLVPTTGGSSGEALLAATAAMAAAAAANAAGGDSTAPQAGAPNGRLLGALGLQPPPAPAVGSDHAAAAAILSFLEGQLLPQIRDTLPEEVQEEVDVVRMQASYRDAHVAVRMATAPGGRVVLPRPPPPPSILLVSPCCVSLTAASEDDTRDRRRQTVTLTVVLACSGSPPGAPPPRVLVRHAGRCLAAIVRPAPPPISGATCVTVELSLSGLRPGVLFLEAAAVPATTHGAADSGGGGGGLLSLPWPVLVVGDPRVAAEVMQLQANLTAAAPLRALQAAATSAHLPAPTTSLPGQQLAYPGAQPWPQQQQQQQQLALSIQQLDDGSLSLLLDFGMWFDAVSMPEAAVAAVGPPVWAGPPSAAAAEAAIATSPTITTTTTTTAAGRVTEQSGRGAAPLALESDQQRTLGLPPPIGGETESGRVEVETPGAVSGVPAGSHEEEDGEEDEVMSKGSWASSSEASASPSPSPSGPPSDDESAPAVQRRRCASGSSSSRRRSAVSHQSGSGMLVEASQRKVDDGDVAVASSSHNVAPAAASAADVTLGAYADGEAQLALLRVLQPSTELLEGSLDCAAEYEQICRRGAALQATASALGIRLLRFTVTRGWPAAATLILKGLLVHCRLSFAEVLERFPSADGGGLPLLHTAVTSGQLTMVRAVVSWGQRCRRPLRWDEPAPDAAGGGLTPLHLAAVLPDSGRLAGAILGLWPDAEAHWASARDVDGRTPQEYACLRAISDGSPTVTAANSVGTPAAGSAPPAGTVAAAAPGIAPQASAPVRKAATVGAGCGGGAASSAAERRGMMEPHPALRHNATAPSIQIGHPVSMPHVQAASARALQPLPGAVLDPGYISGSVETAAAASGAPSTGAPSDCNTASTSGGRMLGVGMGSPSSHGSSYSRDGCGLLPPLPPPALAASQPVILFMCPPEPRGGARSSSWRRQLQQTLPHIPSNHVPPSLLASQTSNATTVVTECGGPPAARSEGPGSGVSSVYTGSGLPAGVSIHGGLFGRFDRASDCGSLSVDPDSQWSHSTDVTGQTYYHYQPNIGTQDLRPASLFVGADLNPAAYTLLSLANLPDGSPEAAAAAAVLAAAGGFCPSPDCALTHSQIGNPTPGVRLQTTQQMQSPHLQQQLLQQQFHFLQQQAPVQASASMRRGGRPQSADEDDGVQSTLVTPQHPDGPAAAISRHPACPPSPFQHPLHQQQHRHQHSGNQLLRRAEPGASWQSNPGLASDIVGMCPLGRAAAAAAVPASSLGPFTGSASATATLRGPRSPDTAAAAGCASVAGHHQQATIRRRASSVHMAVPSQSAPGVAPSLPPSMLRPGHGVPRPQSAAFSIHAATPAAMPVGPVLAEAQCWYEQEAGLGRQRYSRDGATAVASAATTTSAAAALKPPTAVVPTQVLSVAAAPRTRPLPASSPAAAEPPGPASGGAPAQVGDATCSLAEVRLQAHSPAAPSRLGTNMAPLERRFLATATDLLPASPGQVALDGGIQSVPAPSSADTVATAAAAAAICASSPLVHSTNSDAWTLPSSIAAGAAGGRRNPLLDGGFHANIRRFGYSDDYAPLCTPAVGARTAELERLLPILATEPAPAPAVDRGHHSATDVICGTSRRAKQDVLSPSRADQPQATESPGSREIEESGRRADLASEPAGAQVGELQLAMAALVPVSLTMTTAAAAAAAAKTVKPQQAVAKAAPAAAEPLPSPSATIGVPLAAPAAAPGMSTPDASAVAAAADDGGGGAPAGVSGPARAAAATTGSEPLLWRLSALVLLLSILLAFVVNIAWRGLGLASSSDGRSAEGGAFPSVNAP